MADLTDDELMAAIGDAPIRFWMCPVRPHGDRTGDSGWPVVTVEWRGGIARCTAPGCGRTSRPGPADSTPDPEAVMVASVLAASDRPMTTDLLLSAAKAYAALRSSRERSDQSRETDRG